MAARRGALRILVVLWKGFCYSLGALVLAFVLAQLWFFGNILYLSHYNPGSTAFMESRLEALRAKNPGVKLRRTWVPYERISVQLKRAVVAAEDAKFLDHEGFDWEAIQKAMTKNEQRGKVVSGASTISQQLAKNLFLSGERSWLRKGEEAIITWMMERTLSKRRILEVYLNVAEFGPGIYGVGLAAQAYFGKAPADLGEEDASLLAASLPRPASWHPGSRSQAYRRYAAAIRARMDKADFLRKQI